MDIKNIELKEGMLLIQGEEKFLITRNYYDKLIAANEKGGRWFRAEDFLMKEFDAIYDRPKLYAKTCQFSTYSRPLLWKKPEIKEMTVAEIESLFRH